MGSLAGLAVFGFGLPCANRIDGGGVVAVGRAIAGFGDVAGVGALATATLETVVVVRLTGAFRIGAGRCAGTAMICACPVARRITAGAAVI